MFALMKKPFDIWYDLKAKDFEMNGSPSIVRLAIEIKRIHVIGENEVLSERDNTV